MFEINFNNNKIRLGAFEPCLYWMRKFVENEFVEFQLVFCLFLSICTKFTQVGDMKECPRENRCICIYKFSKSFISKNILGDK